MYSVVQLAPCVESEKDGTTSDNTHIIEMLCHCLSSPIPIRPTSLVTAVRQTNTWGCEQESWGWWRIEIEYGPGTSLAIPALESISKLHQISSGVMFCCFLDGQGQRGFAISFLLNMGLLSFGIALALSYFSRVLLWLKRYHP